LIDEQQQKKKKTSRDKTTFQMILKIYIYTTREEDKTMNKERNMMIISRRNQAGLLDLFTLFIVTAQFSTFK
jgi:hypothetical protein